MHVGLMDDIGPCRGNPNFAIDVDDTVDLEFLALAIIRDCLSRIFQSDQAADAALAKGPSRSSG